MFSKFVLLTIIAINAVLASDVVVLTNDNFADTIAQNEYVLAEFYAPWCGHCKSLAPHYEKAATALKGEANIVIGKVDATEEDALAKLYGVTGFPSLKWFVNGVVSDYTGGRTEETIITWIKKKTGPATQLLTADSFADFKESADVTVVGLFATEAEMAAYLASASGNDEIAFGSAIGDDATALLTLAGVESTPAVVVFQKFDEGRADFTGDVTDTAAITKFVLANSLPVIVPFTQQTAQKIFGGDIKKHLLIFLDGESDEAVTILDAAKPVAIANKGDILFVTVDKADARILEFFGLTEEDLPTARAVDMNEAGMKKFAYTEDALDTASIEKFYAAFKAGELSQDLKSDAIPTEQPDAVVTVVGKSFQDIVSTEGKAVLMEFYAPWCGHCKSLAPIYEELAEKYKDSDKVIIGKMDSTANEVDGLSISGFPTLKFYPAGSDTPVDYDGGRDLEGLTAFLEENVEGL